MLHYTVLQLRSSFEIHVLRKATVEVVSGCYVFFTGVVKHFRNAFLRTYKGVWLSINIFMLTMLDVLFWRSCCFLCESIHDEALETDSATTTVEFEYTTRR